MNLLSLFKSRNKNEDDPSTSLYALDHALLNIPLPPPTMWMNMGYWKNTTDFPTACAALLDQVLSTAGLVGENGSPLPLPALHPDENDDSEKEGKKTRRRHLLDVGIGCGDQSLRCLGYRRRKPESHDAEEEEVEEDKDEPLFETYTGITSIPIQAKYAAQRLEHDHLDPNSSSKSRARARIFCANAADPASWSADIHSSIHHPHSRPPRLSLSTSDPRTSDQKEDEDEDENWLLALDTLYHFMPSRLPLLTYTKDTLSASIMAFDLLLSPSASLFQRLVLRILCLFAGTPYTNFLTEAEYISQLVQAGYDPQRIVVRDISEHVFAGVAGFMRPREEVLKGYGMAKGIGKFVGAGRVFGWWARTGVVRGAVVVARV